MPSLMDSLDVEGWRAVLFTEDGEAPEDMKSDDPRVVRREQWFVSGDQYILDEGGCLELGEWGHDAAGLERSGRPIYEIGDLVEIVRNRLAAGEKRESMHPVLLALLFPDMGVVEATVG